MTGERVNVAFVLTTPDAVGGTEKSTYLLTAELARYADLSVSVLGVIREADTPHFADELDVPLMYVDDRREQIPSSGPSRLVDPRWESAFSSTTDVALTSWLWAHRPDVVVVTTPALLALLVQVSPPGTAIIGVEHRATAARGPTGEPIRAYGHLADAYVSLTGAGTDWFAAALGAGAPRLETIPNLVPERFAARSSLERPMVLAAGRLVGSKQFSHLIRAFATARRPGWRLRILGDGPHRERLRRLVLRLGIHDHVDLVPSVPDVAHELAKSSMLAMSSTAEGQPLVALEALAAGVPIVSYDCPVGPRTIVDDGVNGYLVPPNDIEALSERMGLVMDDADLRRRLGAGARESRRRFAPDAVAGAWHDLIIDVSRGTPRRHRSPGRAPQLVVGDTPAGPGETWVPAGGLLLHIGPHKTGTTAVQSAFAAVRSELAELGVVYPGTRPAPHGAVMNRLGTYQGWYDEIPPGSLDGWTQLCVEARTASGTVVVSSEALCHATAEQAAEIGTELRPGPVRVAVTLRPLEHLLPSSWQEYVKSGWTTTFDAFLRFTLLEPDSPDNPVPTFWQRQDHGTLVRRWAEAVGPANVVVIVADPARRDHLHRTFEELLGLPDGLLPREGGSVNRSLSPAEIELVRRVNVAVRGRVEWARYNQVFRQRGLTALVERRRSDALSLRLPAWAVEPARVRAREAIDAIVASGVEVRGDLAWLCPGDPIEAPPESVAAPADVSIDAVVELVAALLSDAAGSGGGP